MHTQSQVNQNPRSLKKEETSQELQALEVGFKLELEKWSLFREEIIARESEHLTSHMEVAKVICISELRVTLGLLRNCEKDFLHSPLETTATFTPSRGSLDTPQESHLIE